MIRPMREDDVDAAHELAVTTFEVYSLARGEEPEPSPDPSTVPPRYLHPLRTDPGGLLGGRAGRAPDRLRDRAAA
jgi:hypothetical protein